MSSVNKCKTNRHHNMGNHTLIESDNNCMNNRQENDMNESGHFISTTAQFNLTLAVCDVMHVCVTCKLAACKQPGNEVSYKLMNASTAVVATCTKTSSQQKAEYATECMGSITAISAVWYRVVQDPCNTVLDIIVQ